MHSDQRLDLQWRDSSVPVSTQFDEQYYSLVNGLAETCHVFWLEINCLRGFGQGFKLLNLTLAQD